MPTSGTRPLSWANSAKARQSRPATIGMSTSPGPPAAALGEQHDRQPAPLGDLEQAVLLEVVAHALRAGQDRVVVGHRHARAAVDLADARDQAVGGRARDQLLARAPALLGGEQQRAVLDEGVLVDELGEVLARRAPPALAASGDRVRARRVEADSRGARAPPRGRRGTRPARPRPAARRPRLGHLRRSAPAAAGPPRPRRRRRPRRCARPRRPRRGPRAPSSSPRARAAPRPVPRARRSDARRTRRRRRTAR